MSASAPTPTRGPWFHNLHFPDGRQTAPGHYLGDFPRFKWQEIAGHVPEDLSGWRALDVGCNAGFYSFELAKRGARMVGIDSDPHYLRQARRAAQQMDLERQVSFRRLQVYDLARDQEEFDLVLFMGVLCHLRYPLLGLDIVARRVKRLLVSQTLTLPGREVADQLDHRINERDALLQPGWPKAAFIEHRFAGDPTNWWILNHAGAEDHRLPRARGLPVRAERGRAELHHHLEPGRVPLGYRSKLKRHARGRGMRQRPRQPRHDKGEPPWKRCA